MSELYDCMGEIGTIYFDLDGNPVERTPHTHPYSYEEFVVFKSQDFDRKDSVVYHDRMLQWDWDAFTAAARDVWPDTPKSQMFSGKEPRDIEKFLSLYFKKNVKLTAVLQGCDISNGFPYWVFFYRKKEEVEK